MRFDVITVFPEYLSALNLSLLGKASSGGTLRIDVHDLRDWTADRHRTVDDTVVGGGAGMVMKPDVWGTALDDVLALEIPEPGDGGRTVLAIPTPSGTPLQQRMVEDLARADRIVIACGRYEGIDARVAEHYASRVEVLEYSIGDYVLNGGEAAALVLIEAVGRLIPGVVGNPRSLEEESHGAAGLLEYPVHTRPIEWRGLRVPDVLLTGHHARIERWRRDRALERTATRRPDMLRALSREQLLSGDAGVLTGLGWASTPAGPRRLTMREATPQDAAALAELAAATFPLANPPSAKQEDIDAFIATHLTPARFAEYLADSARYLLLVAEVDGGLAGYTLSVVPRTADEAPYAADVAAIVPARPAAELSKVYVRAELHGSGISAALLDRTLRRLESLRVEGQPIAAVWLGTNARNRRARRFYERSGFVYAGPRHFQVGGNVEDDAVYVRPLLEPGP